MERQLLAGLIGGDTEDGEFNHLLSRVDFNDPEQMAMYQQLFNDTHGNQLEATSDLASRLTKDAIDQDKEVFLASLKQRTDRVLRIQENAQKQHDKITREKQKTDLKAIIIASAKKRESS